MKLLPSESSFQIQTSLLKEEVIKILKKNISEQHSLNPIPPSTFFRGHVYHSEFEAKEAVWLTKAQVPVFRGKIETTEVGIIVKVKASNVLDTIGTFVGWAFSVVLFFTGARMVFGNGQDLPSGLVLMLYGIFAAVSSILTTS
jgi:hypothetical protein